MRFLFCLRNLHHGGTAAFYGGLGRALARRGHEIAYASAGGPLLNEFERFAAHHTFPAFERERGYMFALQHRCLPAAQRRPLVSVYPPAGEAWRLDKRELRYVLRRLVQRPGAAEPCHLRCVGSFGVLSSIGALNELRQAFQPAAVLCSQAAPTFVAHRATRKDRAARFLPVVNGIFTSGDLFPPLGLQGITSHAHRVLVMTPEVYAHLAACCGVPESKLLLLPNAVDTALFRPAPPSPELRASMGTPAKAPVLLQVSSLVSLKLPMTLLAIDAFRLVVSRATTAELWIVGAGDAAEHVAGRAADINQALGRPAVRLLGAKTDAELAHVLNQADVVLGVGRCARESMACGRPTVVYHSAGYAGPVMAENMDALVAGNFTGRNFPEPSSAERLALDIERLLGDAAWRRNLGEIGRAYIEQHESMSIATDLIEEIAGNTAA